jgi:hypothetical protein
MTTKTIINSLESESILISSLNVANTITSAFDQANTANTNAATADQRAVTSGSYANSAYSKANTALIHAQAAFNAANTGASYDQSLDSTDNVTFNSVTTNTITNVVSRVETQRDVFYSSYFNPNQGILSESLPAVLDVTDSQSTLQKSSYLYGPNIQEMNDFIRNNNTQFNWAATGFRNGDIFLSIYLSYITAEYQAWIDSLTIGDTVTGFYLVLCDSQVPGAIQLNENTPPDFAKPIKISATVDSPGQKLEILVQYSVPEQYVFKLSNIVCEDFEPFFDPYNLEYTKEKFESGFFANQLMYLVEKTPSFSTLNVGQTGDYATADVNLISGEISANGAILGDLYFAQNIVTPIPSPDYYGTGFVENPMVVNGALEVLGAEDIVSTTFTNLTGGQSGGTRVIAEIFPQNDPGISFLQIYLQGRFGTSYALNDTDARSLERAILSLKPGSTIDLVGRNGYWTGSATVTVSNNEILIGANNEGTPFAIIYLTDRAPSQSLQYSANDITFNVDRRTISTIDTVTTFENDVTFNKYITAKRVDSDNQVTRVSSKALSVITPTPNLSLDLTKWDYYIVPDDDAIENLYMRMPPEGWSDTGAFNPGSFGEGKGGYKEVSVMYHSQLPTQHFYNDESFIPLWQNDTAPSETGRKLVTYRIFQGPSGVAGTWTPTIFATYVDF